MTLPPMLQATLLATAVMTATPAAQRAIPANGHATADGWECDRGFRQAAGACEAVRVPANAQIDTAGHGWECNRGFKQVGTACDRLVIPANARLDTLGHDWVCNRGYRAEGESCVAAARGDVTPAPPARPASF